MASRATLPAGQLRAQVFGLPKRVEQPPYQPAQCGHVLRRVEVAQDLGAEFVVLGARLDVLDPVLRPRAPGRPG